jgi:hypothetical protein
MADSFLKLIAVFLVVNALVRLIKDAVMVANRAGHGPGVRAWFGFFIASLTLWAAWYLGLRV